MPPRRKISPVPRGALRSEQKRRGLQMNGSLQSSGRPIEVTAAALLVDRYGEQARQHACRRVDRLLVQGEAQARMLWTGVIAAIDELQQRARAARWRERAEENRICADACITAGAQLAYRPLAEGAH